MALFPGPNNDQGLPVFELKEEESGCTTKEMFFKRNLFSGQM